MGFTLQSLSPSQGLSPLGVRALMLFLATRPPALRTRRLRCPAAPGHCSLQGSVPVRAEAGAGRCSLGLPCLSRAFPDRRGSGFPPSSLLRFSPPLSGRAAKRRFRALPNDRVDRLLAETADSLEVSHQDLSSAPPDDSVPVGYPTGSESACQEGHPDPKIRADPTLRNGPGSPKEAAGLRSRSFVPRPEDRRDSTLHASPEAG
jgi:hypothetical protein